MHFVEEEETFFEGIEACVLKKIPDHINSYIKVFDATHLVQIAKSMHSIWFLFSPSLPGRSESIAAVANAWSADHWWPLRSETLVTAALE